ncbi:MAG: hypothetical protein AB7F86_18125 [Bdellovibrionales bacterium]
MYLKSTLAIALALATIQFAQPAHAGGGSCSEEQRKEEHAQWKAEKCSKLYDKLQETIAKLEEWAVNHPNKEEKAEEKIAKANAKYVKKCGDYVPPTDTFDNHFSADTPYECIIQLPDASLISAGVDQNLILTNSTTPYKTACVSLNACAVSIGMVFPSLDVLASAQCSDPNDQNVLHLTDAEVQAQVNQLLGQ